VVIAGWITDNRREMRKLTEAGGEIKVEKGKESNGPIP